MKLTLLSLADLKKYYDASAFVRNDGLPELVVCRLQCGISYLALLANREVVPFFLPTFESLWWYNAWRFAGHVAEPEKIKSELKSNKIGQRYPFFRQLSQTLNNWPEFGTATREAEASGYLEFMVPHEYEEEAVRFIQEWIGEFGSLCFVSNVSRNVPALIELAFFGDHFSNSDGIARADIESAIRSFEQIYAPIDFLKLGATPDLIPLAFNQAEGRLTCVEDVADMRLKYFESHPWPGIYEVLSNFLAPSQSMKLVVSKSSPERSHWRSMLSQGFLHRLFALGVRLESMHPILGRSLFEDLPTHTLSR